MKGNEPVPTEGTAPAVIVVPAEAARNHLPKVLPLGNPPEVTDRVPGPAALVPRINPLPAVVMIPAVNVNVPDTEETLVGFPEILLSAFIVTPDADVLLMVIFVKCAVGVARFLISPDPETETL